MAAPPPNDAAPPSKRPRLSHVAGARSGTGFQVVFLVDASGSMASVDVESAGQVRMSRIDAVFDAMDCFAEAMIGLDDVHCTLIVFNESHKFAMTNERADASLRPRLREIRRGVEARGGGRYLQALAGFQTAAGQAGVSVGVLLSDGVPSEDMLDADCPGTPQRDRMLATMRQMRRRMGRKCVLHTVGLGSFNADCLQKLAREGGGSFYDNSRLDANLLRNTFRRLFATVSTLRGTVLAFGASALKPLPPRALEPADAWRSASEQELREMREEHSAWIMLPAPGAAAGTDLRPQGPACRATLHRRPFAEGSLRYAFHFFVAGQNQQQLHLVIKEGKFDSAQNSPLAVSQCFLTNHNRAQALAAQYKRACEAIEGAAARVGNFVPAFVIKLESGSARGGARYVTAERYIPGDFIKMNGNDGYVNGSVEAHVAVAAAAFSHFTFDCTNGGMLCVDIQGVGLQWTDPQLHSLDKAFGPADLGREGMRLFFSSHACSPRCRALRLRGVDPESLTFLAP